MVPLFCLLFPLNNPFLFNNAYFKGFLRDSNIFTGSNLPAISNFSFKTNVFLLRTFRKRKIFNSEQNKRKNACIWLISQNNYQNRKDTNE